MRLLRNGRDGEIDASGFSATRGYFNPATLASLDRNLKFFVNSDSTSLRIRLEGHCLSGPESFEGAWLPHQKVFEGHSFSRAGKS
jgi:hypothetical protein